MRINARPFLIDFTTGQPTQYAVSVVGKAPHTTFYVEQHVGMSPTPEAAPACVGAFMRRMAEQDAVSDAVNRFGHAEAQRRIMAGEIQATLPTIPGVTAPGEWRNPRFGNPDRHRQKYGLKHRDARTEREVIGEPERFQA